MHETSFKFSMFVSRPSNWVQNYRIALLALPSFACFINVPLYMLTVEVFTGGKWSGLTTLERTLIFLGIILKALALVVASQKDTKVTEICNSQKCRQTAALIINSLDMSVNPCDNFYDFACATWSKKNVIPEDKSSMNVFDVLQDEVETILKCVFILLKKVANPWKMTHVLMLSSICEWKVAAVKRTIDEKSFEAWKGLCKMVPHFLTADHKQSQVEITKQLLARYEKSAQRHSTEIVTALLEAENCASDLSAFKSARDMYTSCINEDRIEERNISVAIPLLEELGGWPVLGNQLGGNWKESKFDIIQLLVGLMKYYQDPLISMFVSSDLKESTRRIIYLGQPNLGLPSRSYFLEPQYEDRRQAYKKLAVSVAVYFGADPFVAKCDMKRVLEFEIDIANITMKDEDLRDDETLYSKMLIYDLPENITEPSISDTIQFSWLRYIQSVMNLPNVSIPINTSEPVVVLSPPYFQKLFAVLQKHDKRTIANYLVWRIMQTMASTLPKRFNDLITNYNEVIYGTSIPSARWRDCANYVNDEMGMAVGRLFIEETFDETAKSSALAMIRDIRKAFSEILREQDWMDNKTRNLADKKARSIKAWVGYPDAVTNNTHLEAMYEDKQLQQIKEEEKHMQQGLVKHLHDDDLQIASDYRHYTVTVDRNTYFENVLQNLRMDGIANMNNLREEYDRNVWNDPPATVNAFYSANSNSIKFPAGILQPPFYAKDQPKSMNYGGIGAIIGHEITHGFDDSGRQYNKDGNLQEWWPDDVIDRFTAKAQCIVDQYGSYLLPEANMTLNGINTQGENIADNGGLKQSFRAYRKWVQKRGKEEPMLPGLSFNHNQLFFINFAQLWCENLRQEDAIDRILTEVHSPGRFRVIGTLQNSREFAETFGCKRTDYMNPDKKCNVW